MQAQTEAAIAGADAVFFLIDARAGLTPIDRDFADPGAQVRQARDPRRQQERRPRRRGGRARGLCARPRRSDPDLGRAWRGPGRSLRRAARGAARADRAPPRSRTTRARPSAHAADPGRGRRPAQYRQVDADQPAVRRGAAAHRTRGRHHPRRHRGRPRLARPRFRLSRHRRHAAARRASRRSWRSSRSPIRSTRSASPRW